MNEAVYPISGSKFYIGNRVNTKSVVTAADFANAVWVEVDGWTNAGGLGDTQGIGTQEMINRKRVQKFKTTLDGGTMENQFVPMGADPGQIAFKAAIDDCSSYQFKVEWGADCTPAADVAISVATPGVVSWPSNGFSANQPIVFSTTGTLPTPLVVGQVYFVSATGLAPGAFSVSATVGGPAIDITAAGTGIHTATAPPLGMTDMFFGLATPGARSGGTATSSNLRTMSVAVTSNIVEI